MLLAPASPATPSPTPDANALYQEALLADHQNHDYARAIALYGRIVNETPSAGIERIAESRYHYLLRGAATGEEPLRRFETVREEWVHSDHAAAEREVRAIARAWPDFPLMDDLLMWLGSRATADARWEEAQASYRELLARFPESPQRGFAAAALGHACYETHDYDGAAQAYALIASSGIPAAGMIANAERALLARHLLRRKVATVCWVMLALGLLLGAMTVIPRDVPRMAREALGHELIYVGPPLALLVLISPRDNRVDIAWVFAAGFCFLLTAATWARSAAPRVGRPVYRAASAVIVTAAGASVLYLAMYQRDLLAAVENIL